MGGVHLQRESFSCSICLDLLKDPVTVGCGHSFCMNCIKAHWDTEEKKRIQHSCPQCRESFTPRPNVKKNTMLAELVEELKKTELAAPAAHCYAGAEDVACDVCRKRKRKALKSCLVCLVSYCEEHLQPHHRSAPFKKHKLVEPSTNLQENICPRHGKMMDLFCRTDQQCICSLCSVDQHKDHDTVSAAAERKNKQRELDQSGEEFQQRLQDIDKDVNVLQQEVKALTLSAVKAVRDTHKTFTEMIHLLQKKRADVKQQIRSKLATEVKRVRGAEENLQRESTELKKRQADLKQLSLTQDNKQFLLNHRALPALGPSTQSTINVRPLRHFEDVTEAVAEVRSHLQEVLMGTLTNISLAVAEVDVLLTEPRPKPGPEPEPEPKTRDEFLRYSQEIQLDPNTVNKRLFLSEGNRRVTMMEEDQPHPHHTDRYTVHPQVRSEESLPERCYWEVEWRGGGVRVAVTYDKIGKSRSLHGFGSNNKSWALDCYQNMCRFVHKDVSTEVSDVIASRVGVYLDHSAGLLSFYRVSDTMTLIHRVQTKFAQPLYAGVLVYFSSGSTAKFCKLN